MKFVSRFAGALLSVQRRVWRFEAEGLGFRASFGLGFRVRGVFSV